MHRTGAKVVEAAFVTKPPEGVVVDRAVADATRQALKGEVRSSNGICFDFYKKLAWKQPLGSGETAARTVRDDPSL